MAEICDFYPNMIILFLAQQQKWQNVFLANGFGIIGYPYSNYKIMCNPYSLFKN
jgi:hypothetical protein